MLGMRFTDKFSLFITEWKNCFEILPRNQPAVILSARSYEEKCSWMAVLVMLTTKRWVAFVLMYSVTTAY